MTLTGALHLHYGGNPQGPAGTGKTETTKDLAKALAIQCVVFNCSDGLDYKMMGRFFSGLAQGGAWSCFDEFNRIDIEVLSVIAQQMLTIQTAVKQKKDEFLFLDKVIPLNRRFGVFITMNPGYAGRTELPDNLKALFRPVSMMIPDYALIAEIILFSEGFETAFDLARKMVQLYKLSSEQLSKQKHYDFGMRAVKSVLVMAGSLRRREPDTQENIVLIRAMRDSNVPKFLEHDLPLFEGIVTDLFPGINVPFIDYGVLQSKIEANLLKRGYQLAPKLIKKTIQLLETMLVRHGNMIVGEAATGKTTILEVLADALTDLHNEGSRERFHFPVEQYRLNPKSVTRGELFGYTNVLTNEWTDGLVSKLVNDAVESEKPDNLKWIVFDGPVDALWIENMNTVLDDNKTLCLTNGQRIKLPTAVTMIFEVMDLKVASPATVSRCGMVYLEPVHLGWQPLVETWKQKMKERDADSAMYIDIACQYIENTFSKGLTFIREECKEIIQSVDANLVTSCLNLLESVMDPEKLDFKRAVSPEKDIKVYVIFSIVWSLGANIFDDNRKMFNRFMKSRITEMDYEFPDEGTIYDYGIDPTTHTFEPWIDRVTKFEYNPEKSFFSILVPTPDTVRYKFLLDTLLGQGYNVLISGDTGVGKSVITSDYLVNADPDKYVSGFINFSGKTTSKNLRDAFESKLDKKRKTLLGPPGGKKMVFFIDDVNMPQYDEYFSQPPVELLRQAIDSHGFYDLEKLIFKYIKDTQFVTACAPPGGGRNEVTPRLFRHFNMIWVPALSKKSMELIFSSILRGFLELNQQSSLDFLSDAVVRASVEIYEKAISDFKPTPTKSHYTFNLRDMSKVIQGILEIKHRNLEDKEMLVSIWIHEIFRVFRDRLINQSDCDKFNDSATKMMQKHLNIEWDKSEFENIMFGDFDSGPDRDYVKLSEPESLVPRLNDYLETYNASSTTPMNLVFFNDAIFHLTRISRILRSQRGNALLVGVGGSGRRSLATLASHMQDFSCFSIEISKNYREKEWHDDLKELLFSVGAEDQQKVFIFSDGQILNESFLEDINNILNSGEVPNLFAQDEYDNIVETLRAKAKQEGKENKDEILHYFVSLCRQNLHITLAFSPVGEKFRERCLQFPSIINCCTIDWYQKWPREALYSVADRFFTEKENELSIAEYKEALCRMAVEIHKSAGDETQVYYEELRRMTYVTPKSYLDLIKCYLEMMDEQRRIVPQKISRYSQGLRLLAQIKQMVDQLQITLTKLRPEIDRKEEETQQLVVDLEKQQKSAAETEKVFKTEAEESQKLFDQVQELKQGCEADLAKAMPIYESAIQALNTLNKNDIVEMKSYPTPPQELVMVIGAVCVLFKKNENWDEGKKLMNEPKKFLNDMSNYDKDKIPDKIVKKVRKYVKMKDFVPELIAKKSRAGESICKWVIAIVNYSDVMKVIKPKQESLAKAQVELDKAKAELAEKEASLQKIRDQISKLQASYNASLRTLEDLTKQKELIEVQLVRAEKLLSGLESESKRWEQAVSELNVDLHDLVGNIMVCAACCQYIGVFTDKYRTKLRQSWIRFCTQNNIPITNNLSLERVLVDPVTVREWNLNGLPADKLSIENGIYTTNAKRWPLLIDPQSQGNRWIKKNEGLKVVKQSQGKYLQTLENAIRLGAPVLIENAGEELDPALEPILLKQVFKRGGQLVLKLGDSEIPYSNEFNLTITTKLPNPHYLPEVCIKVTIINFTVTPEGLEDQLLVSVVGYERPDLEEQKDQLITKSAELKRQLKETEDKILKLVSEADEDILNDEELINTLEQSKETSIMINERMKEAEEMTKEINANRELYRDVARRGSVLYFVIASTANMDPMYQYSLAFFSSLFSRRLALSQKSDILEERLEILINDITIQFYKNICRGLFEKDKLTYSFLNATAILMRDNRITPEEMSFFCRGPTQIIENENKTEIPDTIFNNLIALEQVHANFAGLTDSLNDAADSVYWKDLVAAEDPSKLSLPSRYEDTLTQFQKLIIRKILREENLMVFIKIFIKNELSEEFIESPPFDLEGAYSDSTNMSPLIFILSPGADPIPNLMNLAKAKGMEDKLKILSLGQGQGKIAQKFIETGQQAGDWVCLQNCHLSSSWMPELERIQEIQTEETTNPDYRLWLTSMPSLTFPVPVLQSGIKITNEPPKGLKANLKRTYNEIEEPSYEDCSKPREYKKLLFALAYFHAVILERRKFGAIGWNIAYEWMNSDFMMSQAQVKMFLDQQPDVPYTALNYLVAEANYGGRVTDDKDVELIKSLLKRYFCPDILRDEYKLSLLDTYYAPKEGTLQQTKDYINTLPLEDDPEIFGLHPNANITFKKKTVSEFLDMLITIQPRSSAGGGDAATPEEIVAAEAAKMLTQVPDILDKKRAHETTFVITESGVMQSLGVFLGQEIDRFNILLKTLKKTLSDLGEAIKGTVVMSLELEKMFTSIMDKKVPYLWEDVGYPSLKPLGSWMLDLIIRVEFMSKWLYEGPPSSYLVPAFFFPQGFMTSSLQTYSRKTQIAIDTLKFKSNVRKEYINDIKQGPDDGVNIHGLYLQGARWNVNEGKIADSKKAELFMEIPVIWLEPILETAKDDDRAYKCPLYKTSLRKGELSTTGHSTNFIMYLSLHTEQKPEFWINRGVALLCQLDD